MAGPHYSAVGQDEKNKKTTTVSGSLMHILRRGGKWWMLATALIIALLLWEAPKVQQHAQSLTQGAIGLPSHELLRQRQKHLVIAAKQDEPLGWTAAIPSDWAVHRYVLDSTTSSPYGLSVPRKTDYETLAYLTYIVNNYDTLPSYVAFVQGQERSWHQHAPMAAKVRALNLTSLERENYISFRCESNMGCERKPFIDVAAGGNYPGHKHIGEFWSHIMPSHPVPGYISSKCCGQFAVTRRAIQRLSKADWERIRAPLLRSMDDIVATEPWGSNPTLTDDQLNLWYERFWHIFFGMSNEYCPSTETCMQEHFSNAIVCAGDTNSVPWENTTWRRNTCRTAFDGLPAGTEPNWSKWHMAILGVTIDLRLEQARSDRLMETLVEEYKKIQTEKFEKEAKEKGIPSPSEEDAVKQAEKAGMGMGKAAEVMANNEPGGKKGSKVPKRKKLGPGIVVDWDKFN